MRQGWLRIFGELQLARVMVKSTKSLILTVFVHKMHEPRRQIVLR